MINLNCDFSKYSFQHYEDAINVGWNANSDMSTIIMDIGFMEKLKFYCDNPVNVDYNGKIQEIEVDGKKHVKGFGEIRILDLKNGKRYAAPNVIYEEIKEGVYIPPSSFIEAVKSGPLPTEDVYKEFLQHYSADFYWGESEEKVNRINLIVHLMKSNSEGFKEYIQDTSNLDLVTQRGSLLNYAILERKKEEAMILINKGIDINMFEGVELLSAIEKGYTDIADMLIDKDVVMDVSELKVNPLVSAIRFHDNYIAEKLLKKNPELLITYSNEFVKNCTMIDIAKRFSNENIISILNQYI